MKVPSFVRLSILSFLLWVINLVPAYWLEISFIRVGLMILFLSAIYVLFDVFYEIIKRKKGGRYLIEYFVLSIIKILFVLIIAYFFLNPENIENKFEALFFLFNYLAFLSYDIIRKVRYVNKNDN